VLRRVLFQLTQSQRDILPHFYPQKQVQQNTKWALILPHFPDENPDKPEAGSDADHENVEQKVEKTVSVIPGHFSIL